MTLRAKLETKPETLLDLARASRSRYFEGLDLIRVGKPWAGIYLAGYAVEMILKNAYFLCKGVSFFDPVKPELDGTKAAAVQVLKVARREEGFHSILFWADMLVAERRRKGRPLASSLEIDLLNQAHNMYDHWWVFMRYRREEPEPIEVKTFVESVSWFMSKRSELWRR
jgi:hypothetical protein